MERVLVIGLDGATWNLLAPWIEEGHLPIFKRLIEEGVYGELESTIPPFTIPAWNSLASGKNPGKLGIFSYLSLDRKTYLFKPDFLYSKHQYIWDILGEMGKRVIVVNAPNVHRANRVNGYLVAGFLYLDRTSLTHPKNLKKCLDEITGGYEVDVLDTDEFFETVERRFEFVMHKVEKERVHARRRCIEKIRAIIEKRFKAIEFLLKQEWDFAFVVFVAPDRVQHWFWTDEKVLLDIYKRLDRKLETLLTMVGKETTVFIVSDHGFGSKRRVFNINEWLLQEGYLRLKTKNNSQRTRITDLLRLISRLSIARSLAQLLPFRLQQPLRLRTDFKIVGTSDVDWKLTRVFTQPSKDDYGGTLYLNLRENNPAQKTDLVEYRKIADEVVRKLRTLRDPITGNRISATVYKKEEIYNGEYLEKAPDMVVLLDNNIHGFNATIGHSQVFARGKGGDHRIEGIFLACGPNIKRGAEVKRAKIYDIVPTILHIFDLPIPRDVDGKVLKNIFRERSDPARREVKYTIARIRGNKKESKVKRLGENEVKKRLERLGYI